MFIFALIIAVIAIAALAIGLIVKSGWTIAGGVLGIVLAGMFWVFATYYTIEPGEAKVLKDWTGVVQGYEDATGPHWKEPWVDAVDFDIRNQLAVFMGDGTDSYNGQPVNGPQITFQDKDGVSGNMDIVVLYSIRADETPEILRDFGSQEGFKGKVIEQDIRSTPRDQAGRFSTIQLLTNRTQLTADIREALEEEWGKKGVVINEVSLQEIRYPDTVKQRFEEAQNARTEVEKAKAELEKATVDAQQKVVQAQAEADANAILAASLTEPILRQRYLDTLAKLAAAGNLLITDGSGAEVMVQR